jgi:signal peptidase I
MKQLLDLILKNGSNKFKNRLWLYIKIIILLACCVITLLLGLFWFTFVILMSIALYLFFNVIVFKHLIKNKWVQGLFKVMGLFILSILIRVFCIDIYTVSGESMENTLYSGDVVFINKLIYGPSIPKSPYGIPWINIVWSSIHKEAIDHDTLWNVCRLKGVSTINRGDIVVLTTRSFSIHNTLFVKRCVALSGDTITIENGVVKINDNLQSEPSLSKKPYYIKIRNLAKFNQRMDSLGIRTRQKKIITKHELYMDLTFREKTLIENEVDSLSINIIDNYGSVIIPKSGMTIQLDNYTYQIYAKTIKESEHRIIEKRNGFFYIKDSIITEYIFQNDYYFLMGDNRYNSIDCREWGIFIPAKYIIGKTNVVLFSNNKFRNKNERLFKIIK